jgi:hypothetical protein
MSDFPIGAEAYTNGDEDETVPAMRIVVRELGLR